MLGGQGVRAWETFRRVMGPLGGAGSEEWGGGCSEQLTRQGKRTELNLEGEREGLKSSELERLGLVALRRVALSRELLEEGHTARKRF